MLPPAGSEPRTEAEREAVAARKRCKSEAGIWAHKRRMADAEGVIGEFKLRHGLGRARCRGTPLFHIQLLLGCTAVNLKRLARQVPEAASGLGALPAVPAPALAQADPAQPAVRRAGSATPRLASQASWTVIVCLN